MKNTLKHALVLTLPIMLGYLFLGTAFGLLLQKSGYNYIWSFLIGLTVYSGSMQFVLISFLSDSISLITVALITLTVNSRYMFYGLSFIEQFKGMGKLYPYMIFSLTDETYSLLCSVKTPEGVDKNKLFITISVLNHIYWVAGSIMGSIIGELISFNTTGIDFAMTALFVVIFIEQWKEFDDHTPAIMGLLSSIVCLLLFGADTFILPSLILTVVLLLLMKSRILAKDRGASLS